MVPTYHLKHIKHNKMIGLIWNLHEKDFGGEKDVVDFRILKIVNHDCFRDVTSPLWIQNTFDVFMWTLDTNVDEWRHRGNQALKLWYQHRPQNVPMTSSD